MKRCKPAAERKLNLVIESLFYPFVGSIHVQVILLAFLNLHFLNLQRRNKKKVGPLSKLQPEGVCLRPHRRCTFTTALEIIAQFSPFISDPAARRCPPGLPRCRPRWSLCPSQLWWSSPVASASPQVMIKKKQKKKRIHRVGHWLAIKMFNSDRCTKMMVQQQSFIQSEVFLQKHPRLKPNMRSVLLDWLIEVRLSRVVIFVPRVVERSLLEVFCFLVFSNKVSDAYTLHRQTFYLAQDYFDRFMLLHNDVEKGMLQLIGITCLFVASKVEVSEMSSNTYNRTLVA